MRRKYLRGFLASAALALLGGCTSTPAPEPQPLAVMQAEQLELTALSVSEAGNWSAASNAWKEVAQRYALLDRRSRQAVALHNQAYADFKLGQYADALTLAEEAVAINEKGQEWWRNQILILQIERKLDPQTQAQRMSSLLSLAEQEGLREGNILLWGLLRNEQGVNLIAEGKTLEAVTLFKEMLEQGMPQSLVLALRANLAQGQEGLEEYEEAFGNWSVVLEESKLLPETSLIAAALAGQGRCLLRKGSFAEASFLLLRAARNYEAQGMKEENAKTLQTLQECQREMGDSLKAEGDKRKD